MNSKELRIGNWYQNQIDKTFEQIESYDIHFLAQGMDSTMYQPIPLTEDWILKLGFEMTSETTCAKRINDNKTFNLVLHKNTMRWTFPYNHGVSTLTIVHHVHQLQNLFFALTGEELTIQQPERS